MHQELQHKSSGEGRRFPCCLPQKTSRSKEARSSLKLRHPSPLSWGEGLPPPGMQEAQDWGRGEDTVPVEGREEAAGGEQDGALGEGTALLVDPFEVALGDVCHANRSG